MFLGASGCGKGTQAKLLIKKLEDLGDRKVLYVETGAKFREFMNRDNHSAKIVKNLLDQGKFMPSFLAIWVWAHVFVEEIGGEEHLVLDGPSRRPPEAPVLDGAFRFYDRPKVDIVHIKVSHEWAKNRLLARGRYDDNKQDIEERLSAYEKFVLPTIEFYRENADYYNVHEINGEQTIDEVAHDIEKAVFGN